MEPGGGRDHQRAPPSAGRPLPPIALTLMAGRGWGWEAVAASGLAAQWPRAPGTGRAIGWGCALAPRSGCRTQKDIATHFLLGFLQLVRGGAWR